MNNGKIIILKDYDEDSPLTTALVKLYLKEISEYKNNRTLNTIINKSKNTKVDLIHGTIRNSIFNN